MEHIHALPQGLRIDEYEFVRVLGVGGFGITYLGYDHLLDKPVAIKEYLPNDLAVRDQNSTVVPKSTGDQNDFEWGLDRFLEEARILARFDHPNIIKVHRFFKRHGTGYIVMEYAEGETLSDRLKRKGSLSEPELRAILDPLLKGLAAVHKAELLHRDIKPGNIIIRTDGSPVLLDFGAARQAVGAKSRSVTSIVTPGYAPIEQYSTRGNQGPWTDIYAMGAVCYRCIAGKAPPDAADRVRNDPIELLAELQPQGYQRGLLTAVDEALRFGEDERPQTLDAWHAMLSGDSGDRGTPPPPPPEQPGGGTSAGGGSGRGFKIFLGMAAALVLMIFVVTSQRDPEIRTYTPVPAPDPVAGTDRSDPVRTPDRGLPEELPREPDPEPEPVPSPPAKAKLVVRSNVTGDRLLLNDISYGATSPREIELEPGYYTVRVEKDGYTPWSTGKYLGSGSTERLHAELERLRQPVWVALFDKSPGRDGLSPGTTTTDLTKAIEKRWEEGFDLRSVVYGGSFWVGSFNTGLCDGQNAYSSGFKTDGLKKVLDERISNGYHIQSVDYGNDSWFMTFCKDPPGTSHAAWGQLSFVEETLTKQREQGRNLTSIEYGDGRWLGVYRKDRCSNSILVDAADWDAMAAEIKRQWDSDHVIHDLAYGEESWKAVVCRQAGANAWSTAETYRELVEKIEKRWEEDWTVIGLTVGEN